MTKWLRDSLTTQVLVAMALGIAFGALCPAWAKQCQFISDIFIRLVKMVIAPIVFITVANGLSGMGSLGEVGALGLRAVLYFEVVTTAALALGLALATLIQPGAGIDLSHVQHMEMPSLAAAAPTISGSADHMRQMVVHVVPESAVGALAGSDMLPILVFAVFFGLALARLKEAEGQSIRGTLEKFAHVFFEVIALVMKLSPAAAFAAMAFAVGQFGLGSLWALGKLLLAVYAAMLSFMLLILAPISRLYGFSLLKLLRHIWGEVTLVFGTSSSESALPGLIQRLTEAGCSPSVVGLVVPTGYSFNLDGTSIYLSMAVLFVAQAYQVPLDAVQIAWIMAVLLLTSKGAAGVTGSGFITLAATLSALPGQPIPLEGLVLLVGVDRFMSAARALTNLVGNSVATVVLAKSQQQFEDRHVI